MTDLYMNVKALCEEKDLSIRQMESEAGLPENSVANWKEARRWYMQLLAVANYFDVSLDFLFGRTTDRNSHK